MNGRKNFNGDNGLRVVESKLWPNAKLFTPARRDIGIALDHQLPNFKLAD